jgi:anti-sigma B factor antagonist
MIINMRPVTIHELPGQVNAAEERIFMQDMQRYIEAERPRLVLDCSRLRRMDKRAIHLLLSCLEEAMKLNGDVKLAALHPEAKATLWLAGARRLFETYPTTADAVHSYHQRPTSEASWEFDEEKFDRSSGNAV